MDQDILILSTGGTIDMVYDPFAEGHLTFAEGSFLPQIIAQTKAPDYIKFKTLFLKDSADITATDRKLILNEILSAPQNHIVVTHGTITMTKTAEFLKGKTGDKIVVLTGAMRPYSLGQSDSEFNLGTAIMAVQLKGPGVYVAMNGQCFEAGTVKKNKQTGIFEAI